MHLALTVLLVVVVVVVESGSDATPMEHYPTSVAGRCYERSIAIFFWS